MSLEKQVGRALLELARSSNPEDRALLKRLRSGAHTRMDIEVFANLIESLLRTRPEN